MSDFYSNGTRWGSIDNNGEIFSSTGTYLGTLDEQGKFRDSHGHYMGSINSKGEIYDSSYKYLGSVWSNGELHNDVGDYIGMFPYHNGRIGKFSLNGSETNNRSDNENISKPEPRKPEPRKPEPRKPGPIISPTSTDDVAAFFIYGLGFLLILAGYLKIKETLYTPYVIILIPLSVISALMFLLTTDETNYTAWEGTKPLFLINFTLCIAWTLVLNILILNQDITWAVVDILVNYLVSSLVFAAVMTILSLIVSIILKMICSEGVLKFLLLIFAIFTCVLIVVYTAKLRNLFDYWDDPITTETTTETSTPVSPIIEDKVKQISANYNDIQNNLDSMAIDTYETGKLYYYHEDIAKMIVYTYDGNYTMEAFYKDLAPNFIYLEEKNTGEEYRFYYDDEHLIRYIDSDGNITDYKNGLDVSTYYSDESDESELYFDAYQTADSVIVSDSSLISTQESSTED